jgi:hypothetical protein
MLSPGLNVEGLKGLIGFSELRPLRQGFPRRMNVC